MNAPLVSGYFDQSVNYQIHLLKNQNLIVDSKELVLQFNDKYHNLTEVYLELENFEKNASHIIDYSNIGYSFNNNSIPLITLTDEQISDDIKGKTYLVAHHHAREQITIEHTIRTIRDLVNNYNRGDEITIDLLSKNIIYFIVTLNPDSLDHVLNENECLRKTMRPYDEDGDGLFDEDGPDDVNNDGRISEYYEYFWNQSLEDWILLDQYYEGIDDDGDGLFNEDRIGGVDLNRNYPFHWNDSSADSGWGSDLSSKTYPGPEPASENETRALIDFVSKHNFTHAHSLHSGTNTTLFDWSYTNKINQPEAPMYRDMLIDFKARDLLPASFFAKDNEIDYTCAGEWGDWTYATQQTIPLTTEIYHMEWSENWTNIVQNGNYATCEHNTMFEYFNPPEDKIEALHQELFGFEEYWLSLTPWIKLVTHTDYTTNNAQVLNLKLKSGSWYFNTTDKAIVTIIPSVSGVLTNYPSSLDPLQPRESSILEVTLEKNIPEGFYLDVNISSQWAADLQLRVEVDTSSNGQVSGFEGIVILLSLIATIPIIRKSKKGFS